LHCKNQSVNDVEGNKSYLIWKSHETYKYNCSTSGRSRVRFAVVSL